MVPPRILVSSYRDVIVAPTYPLLTPSTMIYCSQEAPQQNGATVSLNLPHCEGTKALVLIIIFSCLMDLAMVTESWQTQAAILPPPDLAASCALPPAVTLEVRSSTLELPGNIAFRPWRPGLGKRLRCDLSQGLFLLV